MRGWTLLRRVGYIVAWTILEQAIVGTPEERVGSPLLNVPIMLSLACNFSQEQDSAALLDSDFCYLYSLMTVLQVLLESRPWSYD